MQNLSRKFEGRPKRRKDDNIELYFQDMGYGVDWIYLAQDMYQ